MSAIIFGSKQANEILMRDREVGITSDLVEGEESVYIVTVSIDAIHSYEVLATSEEDAEQKYYDGFYVDLGVEKIIESCVESVGLKKSG